MTVLLTKCLSSKVECATFGARLQTSSVFLELRKKQDFIEFRQEAFQALGKQWLYASAICVEVSQAMQF